MTPTFALITGASSGIGAAFARVLPARTNLLLTGRNAEALTALQTELSRHDRTVEVIAADLTTTEGRQALIAKAGTLDLDLLISNAALGPFGPVLDNDPAEELATAELNVVATTVLTRALLPDMVGRARRHSRRCGVILMSSTTAFQPVPYLATYSASKAFILAYGEALAEEVRGQPVDILVLCPGATRTGWGERSGFHVERLPGAADPLDVAREGLWALGRRTVHVLGWGTRTALTPLLLPRRLAAGGLGAVMGMLKRDERLKRDEGAGHRAAR